MSVKFYKLVIVDDEKKILDGIAEIFPWSHISFEVMKLFTRADEALEYLENHEVDVVMTDIKMPNMNGIEFITKLQMFSEGYIVVLSSFSDYSYMRDALKLGVQDYLLKPISYNEVFNCFEKIKDLLDKKNNIQKQTDASYYEKIIYYVDEYLEENFRNAYLSDVAEKIGISTNYLSSIYKEKKGMGFQEYLNKIRMKKAAEMLMDVSYKSYEIAFRVGYDSPRNFTRAFKKFYNVTPRDYKNGIRSYEKINND